MRLKPSNVMFDVAIKQIPTIPVTVAIPVVFSPRISPSNIKYAAVNARTSPVMNSGKNVFLLLMIGCYIFSQLRDARKVIAIKIIAIPMIISGGPSPIFYLHSRC